MDRQSPSEEHDATIPPSAHEHVPGNDTSFDPSRTMPNKHMRRENGELNVGDIVLGRYELLEKLGSGAMGVVFKCRDQVSQVEYALKMVPPELAHDAEAMEDVRENFKLVQGLSHPNIAGVKFLERDEYGAYFLIMEHAPGITLSRWIKRKWDAGHPETDEVHAIVKQIASALDYAHRKRILHRDIKPANIMVDENGEVKVLDFGLASKVRNSMTAMSINPANAGGTPGYLAPEQFKGRYPTPAADQYALGVLAYQMLAGHLPFDSDDYNVLRSAVVNEDPDPVDGISRTANDCLQKVLNKDPKLRFACCADFADELKSAFGEINVKKASMQTVKSSGKSEPVPEQVPQNIKKNQTVAKQHLKKNKSDDANAQYDLAECYYYGTGGIKKDYVEAIKCYRKAAEQGHAKAQHALGELYKNGNGVKQDYIEAAKWYRLAAQQGIPFQLYTKKDVFIVALHRKVFACYWWLYGLLSLLCIPTVFFGYDDTNLFAIPLVLILFCSLFCFVLAILIHRVIKKRFRLKFIVCLFLLCFILGIVFSVVFDSLRSVRGFIDIMLVFFLVFLSFPVIPMFSMGDLFEETGLILKDASIKTSIFGVPWHQIKQLWKER